VLRLSCGVKPAAALRLGGYCLCPMLVEYADIFLAHLTVRGETLLCLRWRTERSI
jgi:hypothetical protein